MEFLEQHKKGMETTGFWIEEHRSIPAVLEMQYKTEIIKEYYIADFVDKGGKILVKWQKRLQPLNDVQMKDKYGR